jgi:hypothetical protein
MSETKKSFVLYSDLIFVVKKLVIKDRENKTNYAGELFLHVLEFVNGKDEIPIDFIVEMALEPIKAQLKRDLVAYEKTIETKSASGAIGNLKRWHIDLYQKFLNKEITLEKAIEIAKSRTAIKEVTNIAVTDTVTDTVTDNDILLKKETKELRKIKFSPPSILEVQDYIIEKRYGVNAHAFWNFYESKNWYVGKNKMQDWKRAVAGWESREKVKPNQNQNGKPNTNTSFAKNR